MILFLQTLFCFVSLSPPHPPPRRAAPPPLCLPFCTSGAHRCSRKPLERSNLACGERDRSADSERKCAAFFRIPALHLSSHMQRRRLDLAASLPLSLAGPIAVGATVKLSMGVLSRKGHAFGGGSRVARGRGGRRKGKGALFVFENN